jgi:hypothetical protein
LQKDCEKFFQKTAYNNFIFNMRRGELKKIKRIYICAFLILIFVLSIIAPVYGWDSHGLTLSYELTNVDWLPKYDNITVTAYSYEDVDTSAINPLFKIEYLDAKIGDKTTAAKILTTYADEPDWNMDTDLNVSKFQKFTGGSQGFRHQYYGVWFIRLGQGPERAQYWFDLAEKAHEKGDGYWTF